MSLQFYWSVIPIENILPSHAHLIHIPYQSQEFVTVGNISGFQCSIIILEPFYNLGVSVLNL